MEIPQNITKFIKSTCVYIQNDVLSWRMMSLRKWLLFVIGIYKRLRWYWSDTGQIYMLVTIYCIYSVQDITKKNTKHLKYFLITVYRINIWYNIMIFIVEVSSHSTQGHGKNVSFCLLNYDIRNIKLIWFPS